MGANIKSIYTRKGFEILVDDDDYEKLNQFTWCLNYSGYAVSKLGSKHGKLTRMHRMIMNEYDPKIQIDHISRNKLDNRKENLRRCTNSQNGMNKLSKSNSKTGLKGVSSTNGIWFARINLNNKSIYLGTHKTKEDAARAYNEAAIKYHGEFARLNDV